MAAAGACLFSAALFRRPAGKPSSSRISSTTPRLAVSVDRVPASTAAAAAAESGEGNGAVVREKRREEKNEKEKENRRMNGWKEYLEYSKELIEPDGGPPRWFSPLECASRLDNSPLLLFLPERLKALRNQWAKYYLKVKNET
ncbi:Acyltransferase-like protein, chloroplastic [Glycine max]|nr:Acyltransferase-like protein, chloroplastic [Glycine max]